MASPPVLRPPPPAHRGTAGAGVDVGLRRVVVGYRIVGALWATLLSALLLASPAGAADRRVVAGALLLVWSWTIFTVLLAERREGVLRTWAWIASDIAVGAAAIASSTVAGIGATSLAGGWPFAVVLLAVWARGLAGGMAAAAALSAVSVARLSASSALPPAALPALNEAVGSSLVYLAGAAVGSWGIGVLRRAEAERLAVEAALSAERGERRLAEERAETAAHLHDSVLQTLALIQRRSEDPGEVVGLARRQERELRGWLSGTPDAPARFAAAMRALAADVEAVHRVAVDPVVVGDDDLDEQLSALVAASREALVNAAMHAGVDSVDLYAEVDRDAAQVFVRDRGRGFDPAGVGADRRGLRDSVVGRMHRSGGSATVRSAPLEGTEVVLRLERSADGTAADLRT